MPTRTATQPRPTAELRDKIDARKKELAELIAQKAGFALTDLLDSYVAAIIQQNADLLTPLPRRHQRDADFDQLNRGKRRVNCFPTSFYRKW